MKLKDCPQDEYILNLKIGDRIRVEDPLGPTKEDRAASSVEGVVVKDNDNTWTVKMDFPFKYTGSWIKLGKQFGHQVARKIEK